MGKREDNKRRKEQALLEAGLRAFTAEGYDRASIETVAREAGVARGTFYLYFEDKLALFKALVLPWTEALLGVVQQVDGAIDATEDPARLQGLYEGMAMQIALLGLQHQPVILLAFRELRAASEGGVFLRAEEHRLLEAATGMTAHAAERGLLQIDNPAVVTRMVLGAVERLTFDVLTGVELGPPLQVAAEVVGLFSRSLLQQTPRSQDPDRG